MKSVLVAVMLVASFSAQAYSSSTTRCTSDYAGNITCRTTSY